MVGHAIAAISDMHPSVNWQLIAKELIAASQAARFMFHVLDLRELQRLVSYSAGRPALLEAHLTRRWELVARHGNALVRTQFASAPAKVPPR